MEIIFTNKPYFKVMMLPSYSSKKITTIFLLLILIPAALPGQSRPTVNTAIDRKSAEPENLNVFQDWNRWNNPGSMRTKYLHDLAGKFYEERNGEIAKLVTANDWKQRQVKMKIKLRHAIGPFPGKTPLNPRVTGVVSKPGYRIEKIAFESWQGFYVTGCLFIPDKINGKAPAVLNLIGHEQDSYHAPLDQVIILNLVNKGMIVFTIDPLGQGEHVQYFDPKINFSSIGYSVVEHSYFGNICFLNGSSSAKYFVWDGIRAIDYLVSRPEVDTQRIGVTGFSGGGTVTAYLAAMDPRVKVAIPCSWSIYNQRLMEMKGTQDAETLFIGGLKQGISFEDLIEVRAPKPTLMTFTSRDEYLSMQGALDAYREAKKVYSSLGQPENLQLVIDDSKHWLTPKIRLAIYSFFMKHFSIQGDPAEVEVDILPSKDLMVTPSGQIFSSLGGDMVFDVNKKESIRLLEKLDSSRKNLTSHLKQVLRSAKGVSGFIDPCCPKAEAIINGRYQREGYTVSKYALKGEGDYAIPFLLFVPNEPSERHPAILYLHPHGKITEAKPGGEIEQLVRKGYIIAAMDPLGVGETANLASRGMSDSYTGVLIGRSLVGIQAGDIIRVVNYLRRRSDIDSSNLGAIAKDEMGIPLLHAAAFTTSIKTVILEKSLISYRSVVMNRIYKIGLTARKDGGTHHPYEIDFSWGIAGVLKAYDLPDLMGSIAPRRMVLLDLKNQLLEPASTELMDQELEFTRSVYKFKKLSENLKVNTNDSLLSAVDWAFK